MLSTECTLVTVVTGTVEKGGRRRGYIANGCRYLLGVDNLLVVNFLIGVGLSSHLVVVDYLIHLMGSSLSRYIMFPVYSIQNTTFGKARE